MADLTPVYQFEWDTAKARANLRKHRVSFEEATTVFLDPRALSVYDVDHSEAGDRWITLGLTSAGRLVVVCHTFQETNRQQCRVRIISSRRATRKERDQYAR